jgi:hypothetical protein
MMISYPDDRPVEVGHGNGPYGFVPSSDAIVKAAWKRPVADKKACRALLQDFAVQQLIVPINRHG